LNDDETSVRTRPSRCSCAELSSDSRHGGGRPIDLPRRVSVRDLSRSFLPLETAANLVGYPETMTRGGLQFGGASLWRNIPSGRYAELRLLGSGWQSQRCDGWRTTAAGFAGQGPRNRTTIERSFAADDYETWEARELIDWERRFGWIKHRFRSGFRELPHLRQYLTSSRLIAGSANDLLIR
jgi:hypothetical protein